MKKIIYFLDVCLSFGHVKPVVVVTRPVLADQSLSPTPLPLITNPPLTSPSALSKKIICDMRHMVHILLKCEVPNSYGLGVKVS